MGYKNGKREKPRGKKYQKWIVILCCELIGRFTWPLKFFLGLGERRLPSSGCLNLITTCSKNGLDFVKWLKINNRVGHQKWFYLSKGLHTPFRLKDNLYRWKFSWILMRLQMSGRMFEKCALYCMRNSFGFKNAYSSKLLLCS